MISSCNRASQTNRLIRGFAAGVEKLYRFDRRHVLTNQLSQPAFQHGRARTVETGAITENAANGFGDMRIVVSQKMRRERKMVINVAITFGIPEVSALAFDKNDFRAGCPVHRNHAAGNVMTILLEDFCRPWIATHQ